MGKDFIMNIEGLSELVDLYDTIDEKVNVLSKQTGIACKKFCSTCCETPSTNIETTIFEMMPLCLDLWQTNMAENILNRISSTDPAGQCIFYTSGKLHDGVGYCSIYKYRPLVCRLFGFSAVIKKNNEIDIFACSIIKKNFISEISKIKENKWDDIILISYYSRQCSSLNASLGEQKYSVNMAVKLGLEYLGLKMHYGKNMLL
jgi:uncharacterized protein